MTGVEVPISHIRSDFEAKLWPQLTNKTFYGRAFRNLVDTGNSEQMIAQVFIGGADGDYQDIMFDDTLGALCFFDVEEDVNNAGFDQQPMRDVNIVFAVNLQTLYGQRNTELAYYDVYQVLRIFSLEIEVKKIVTGLKAYGDLSTERLKKYDMHPWHTFAFQTMMRVDYRCFEN